MSMQNEQHLSKGHGAYSKKPNLSPHSLQTSFFTTSAISTTPDLLL
jgi:hypothetical protein